MLIKRLLRMMVERITGHKCGKCRYNCSGRCAHPANWMYMRCWQSITHPGFEPRQPKYLKTDDGLTEEERYQLRKIKYTLQEAGNTAMDGGLIGGGDE